MTGDLDDANQKLSSLQTEYDTLHTDYTALRDDWTKKTETLDQIVGVRRSLVEQLSREFSEAGLSVDHQTGAVTFASDLLFGYNSSLLTQEGKDFLDDFFPRYISILLSDEYIGYISEIIIEGHADPRGGYIRNLELSQDRALAVSTYMLADDSRLFGLFDGDDQILLRKIVTANGRSFSDPILTADGTVDMDRSRRVEIEFQLKDEDMIAQMIEVLSD